MMGSWTGQDVRGRKQGGGYLGSGKARTMQHRPNPYTKGRNEWAVQLGAQEV